MNISFSDKISLAAIIISIATLVFTIVKANSDRKKHIASKRTEVLIQLSSVILMLDNTKLELENWLKAELCLWPDKTEALKKQSHEEQKQIIEFKDEMQKKYDSISNYSRNVDPIFMESMLSRFNTLRKQCEAMKNRAKRVKDSIDKQH